LRLGSGELRTGGFRRESILADAVEALIGARYLEAGLRAATLLVQQVLAPELEAVDPSALAKDAKTRLQELLQGRGGGLPVYTLLAAEGEPHAQTFTVQCEVELPRRVAERRGAGADAALLCTEGSGSSRRRAEQQAAERILAQLQQPGESP
jgi:ribonuclease-3